MSPPLHYVRTVFGQLSQRLSPFELNPLKGVLNPGFQNTCRRIGEEIPYVVPPFILSYLVFQWGEHKHHHLTRKNPADYANDK